MQLQAPIVANGQTLERSRQKTDEAPLRGHRLPVTCLCIDSRNRHVFTGSKDGSIIKWGLKGPEIKAKIKSISARELESDENLRDKHHTRHVNCLAISSDDKLLASGGWDKLIRVWCADQLTWLHTFKMHKQEITALAFRQGHSILYSGSADRSMALWTLEDDCNRSFIEALYGHESPVTSIDVRRKERVLSAGGGDRTVRIWKIVEQAQTVFESKNETVDVARFIDDKFFVTGGGDGSVSVWNFMKRTPVFTLKDVHHKPDCDQTQNGPCRLISALATFSLKADKILKPVKKRRKVDGKTSKTYDEDDDSDDAAESEDDDDDDHADVDGAIGLVATGSCNSRVYVWRLKKMSGKFSMDLLQDIECPGFVNDLRFTSDGKHLVAACGQEHRFGRWWKLKGVRNTLRVLKLNKF